MPGAAQPNAGIIQGWQALEDGWGDQMNANLRALDLLVMPRVLDKDIAVPPSTPTSGDAYIVAASPTGAWAGHATHIARWQAPVSPATTPVASWEFIVPKEGWEVWLDDDNARVRFDGAAWGAIPVLSHSHAISDTTGLQAALDSKALALVAVNAQTGTTYTLAASDAGKVVRQSNASPITTTVPANSAVAIAVGSVIAVRQTGDGQITLTEGSGVAINTPTGFVKKTGRKHATMMLHKVGIDEWDLTGDLAAA